MKVTFPAQTQSQAFQTGDILHVRTQPGNEYIGLASGGSTFIVLAITLAKTPTNQVGDTFDLFTSHAVILARYPNAELVLGARS